MTKGHQKFVVDPGWRVLLTDLCVAPQTLLRQAGLPLELFSQPETTLTVEQYFDFWRGLESLLSSEPAFPLKVAQSVTVEAFSPPIFACICSDNLNLGLKRLAQYKPLIGPLRFEVALTENQTTISLSQLPGQMPLPPSLVAMELTFLVHLARLATRDCIIPLKVQSTTILPAANEFETFFGIPPTQGPFNGVIFSAIDAQKPFLTSNAGMWSIFKPVLQKRMQDLTVDSKFRDRVRACLMEILASGQFSMADVAKRLEISPRTLQRRLQEEDTHFKAELSNLREELAKYYLMNTPYSIAEISFLLGYGAPSSFFRAFHIWTGETPDAFRR